MSHPEPSRKIPRVVREQISADAVQLHEELLREGVRAWGVVCEPEWAEVYFYEEESEENVRAALERAKNRRRGGR